MFRNYLKTTLRNLWKNKTYSFINIIGLSLGTLCCIYILIYVMDQYSFDKHHKEADSIYRVVTTTRLSGDLTNSACTSPPIAPAMKMDFPEVEQYTRLVPTIGIEQHLIHYAGKSLYLTDCLFADSTFFDVFTCHFDRGTPEKALTEPYSIVLMKSEADRIFGQDDPLGKSIEMDDGYGRHDFRVTAVIDERLGKTHIKANAFMNMNSGGIGEYAMHDQTWSGNNFASAYIKLRPGTNAKAFESKLPAFLNKYGEEQLKQVGMEKQLHLQPVGAIHTTTGYAHEMIKTVSPAFLTLLLLIAALIQLIACINFMNLATARASKRAKEVGVRKVVGAGKGDLVRQFLGESIGIALLGVLIALPLLSLALPYLNQITNSQFNLSFLRDPRIWMLLLGLVLVTGLLAGSYPAFYLSAYRVIKVLKGNFSNHVSANGIRRGLVVFQFVLSVVLIAGIIVIYSQIRFMNQKDLGFSPDQRLVFNFYTSGATNRMPAFMNDLRKLSEVKSVSRSSNYLTQFVPRDYGVYPPGGNRQTAIDAKNILTDEYFVSANGIQLLSGRDFRQGDSGKVLINETLARRLQLYPEKAAGTRLYAQFGDNMPTYQVIAGVMKDFNYNSLHNEVSPLMLIYDPENEGVMHVTAAVSTGSYSSLIKRIRDVWEKEYPDLPFEYSFLDDEVQKQYQTEVTLSRIINSFTLMAIFISCLGLFGLVAFSAEQRYKEIGVRKVLGASVPGIVRMLSTDFLKLVFLAILIATPLAWWGMHQWLQSFVYRVSLQWWMFAMAGAIAILIAVLTIGLQAVKAAMVNPVRSLRSE